MCITVLVGFIAKWTLHAALQESNYKRAAEYPFAGLSRDPPMVADLEGESEEGEPEPESGEVTQVCEFSNYSIGDCGHLEFDCGDFADAELSDGIPAEERKLWDALTNDDDIPNANYVGKSFKITYQAVKA